MIAAGARWLRRAIVLAAALLVLMATVAAVLVARRAHRRPRAADTVPAAPAPVRRTPPVPAAPAAPPPPPRGARRVSAVAGSASRWFAAGARAVGVAAARGHALTLLAWVAAAAALAAWAPGPGGGSGGIGLPVPRDAAAIAAQERSYEAFGFPLLSRTIVVQRDPRGLDPEAVTTSLQLAARVSLGRADGFREVRAAVPVGDVRSLRGGRGPRTVVTFLVIAPSASGALRTTLAERYADRLGPGARVVGVTGTIPARQEMIHQIRDALPWVTLATVLLVAAVLTVAFRAPGPALVALAAVAVAYFVSSAAVGWVGRATDLSAPGEAEPVIVVLLFGIVTDYTVFMLAAARRRLRAGGDGRSAARAAVADASHVVAAAGLTVTGGTAALLAARLGFFRAFGPGLAVTALVGTVVSLTFVPAAVAVGGRLLFRPAGLRPPRPQPWRRGPGLRTGRAPGGAALRRAGRRGAAVLAVAAMAALAAAAWGARLDPTVIGGLPGDASAARAAAAAEQGFPPGITAPAVVLVRGPGVTAAGSRALQRDLADEPGVAAILGPATPARIGVGPLPSGVFLTRAGDAARYLILFGSDPLGPGAIDDVRGLQRALPGMLARAGMPDAVAEVGGDTAIASEALHATRDDLVRVGGVAVLAILLVLSVTLGSFLAPLVLLAGAVLALFATIGATSLVAQEVGGAAGVQYFVPFAAAVLLLSLGSDYGVYMLRSLGERAGTGPPAQAVTGALHASAGPIALAATILAGSFALLAIVPLDAFRQFAVAMVIGITLAAIVVPMVVVPAALAVIGRTATRRGLRWPGSAPPDRAGQTR